MKVNGIIAEYNPFHNGHKYQLETCRQMTGADYTIIAISGNFMQRGTPAILNKYLRAEMALLNGADLVLEIPAFYACGSAEFFAKGAVSLLDKLGVVDYLCFGSEHGDTNGLYQIARLLAEEPQSYKECLSAKLSQGLSFPAARAQALSQYPDFNEEILTSPNNILGMEYIKALLLRNSPIKPVTVKRLGADYHEKEMDTLHSSALAIRHAVFSVLNTSPDWAGNPSANVFSDGSPALSEDTSLSAQMPESSYRILMENLSSAIQPDDLSQLLLYKLLSESASGYDRYLDISPDLSDKILKNLYQFTTFTGFCDLLKSKDTTHTRLSRSLLHILLDITSNELQDYKALDYVPYARVLGLKKSAAPLLCAIKQNTSIPLVSKLADANQVLEGSSLQMLKKEIQISHIYNALESTKSGHALRNEYRTPIVVLD